MSRLTKINEAAQWLVDQHEKIAWDLLAERQRIRRTVCDHNIMQLRMLEAWESHDAKAAVIANEFETKMATIEALWACEHEPAYKK